MKKCYGYIRVSTKYQVRDGVSLEFQEKEIREYVRANNLELIDIIYDKGKSGRQFKGRREILEILEKMKEGEILITYSLSRLIRKARDFHNIDEDLRDKKCAIVAIKDKIETLTTMGKCYAGMVALMAELESNVTSDRVKEGMLMKKEKGEFYGRISYGWKLSNGKGSDLIEVPEQQEVIRKIKEMKKDRETVKNIIKYLEDNNIPPPKTSKKWHTSTIYGIINRGKVITKGRDKKE
jgi:site-specific DNA recombinase